MTNRQGAMIAKLFFMSILGALGVLAVQRQHLIQTIDTRTLTLFMSATYSY